MTRPVLSSDKLSPQVAATMAGYHQQTISEVTHAIASNKIVVVGMGINPFVKKARALLSDAGVEFKYLEYGSYFSLWKPRLAIKMWSGWPTFPQVFVDGKLIGGFKELAGALKDGSIVRG